MKCESAHGRAESESESGKKCESAECEVRRQSGVRERNTVRSAKAERSATARAEYSAKCESAKCEGRAECDSETETIVQPLLNNVKPL